jgi:hypothetical protein
VRRGDPGSEFLQAKFGGSYKQDDDYRIEERRIE